MQIAQYLEVWTKLQCAGGARLAYAQAPLEAQETRSVLNEELLTAACALTDPIVAQLGPRRILRVTYPDASFDEWIIDWTKEEWGKDGAIRLRLQALDPLTILGAVAELSRTESDGSVVYEFDTPELTPTEILTTYVLPALAAAGATWVALGTITPAIPVTLTVSWDTPLAALKRLAEITNCELRLRRNGTTNYLIDLVTQVGSGATTLDLRYGKNLFGASREFAGADLVTRVFGKGAALDDGIYSTLDQNRWQISAIAGSDVTLVDPAGGAGPIGVDDQLNGLYLDKLDGTTPVLITDSVQSTQKATLASVAGLSVNQKIRLCRTSAGAPITSLDHPVNVQDPPTGYGVKVKTIARDDLPAVVNEGTNPAMRNYAGASSPPDGYVKLGNPTLTRTSTANRWLSGGFSCRIQGTADGDGIETPYLALRPTAARPYFSGYWIYWVDAGQVRVEMIAAAADQTVSGITRVGSTATATTGSAHGLAPGQLVELRGATQAEYNGLKVVTAAPTTTTVTFEVAGTPTTPATGTILAARCWRIPDFGDRQAASEGTATWDSLGVAGQNLQALGASRAKLRLVQHGTTACDVYADAYQLTQTAGFEDFLEGSGATRLWQACNEALIPGSTPAIRWLGSAIDVQGIDPAIWTYEAIAIGQAVRVTVDVLGRQETVRLLGWQRDLLTRGIMPVTLGTDFPSLLRTLLPIRIPQRRPRDGAVDTLLEAYAFADPVPDTPGSLLVRLTANVVGATLYYWIGDLYQTPPNEGMVQAGAPASDKYGTYVASFTLNQDQTKDLQLCVFAQVGTRRSKVTALTIDRNALPQITSITLIELTGEIRARADWTVDDDVRRVRFYRDAGAGATWPVALVALAITRASSTATAVATTPHHLKTGDLGSVTGATQTEYNVTDQAVTVVDALTFTYPVAGTPATPATGAPVFKSCRNPLDETKFVVVLSPTADGGGVKASGVSQAGGTSDISGTLVATNKAYAIAVPLDYRDNVGRPEDRGGARLTIVGTPSPSIDSMTATRTLDGTACDTTDGAQYTFTWTGSALVDGTNKVRVTAAVGGDIQATRTNPDSVLTQTVRIPYKRTSGKFDPPVTVTLRWELLDGSDAVIQSATLPSDSFNSTCAL